jgi:hypothetical protein
MDSGGLYGTLSTGFGRIQTECPRVSICRHLRFMDNCFILFINKGLSKLSLQISDNNMIYYIEGYI